MAYSDNPGSIHNQIGRTLYLIDLNIEQEDVPGVINHIQQLRSKLQPFWNDSWEAKWADIPSEADDYSAQFQLEMRRERLLLEVCADNNVYAFKNAEVKDAGALALV